MEKSKLKKFAQYARRSLMEQVSAKLKVVLTDDSAARRESIEAVRKLEEAIKLHGKGQVVERVAYIWFNRFCALRFMDVKRYNRVNIVSPADPGQFQPEILAEAKMGHLDEEMVSEKTRQQIFALLDGKAPSRDPQGEAFRLLVVAACNFWYKAMPFLFQRIDDYTELLMPDDLLSGNSILAYTREAMTPDACEDVEVIGWLYQFYISEKKDEVFAGLKKNKKITPENIPAATQLFTPHWIVRYLVENSLGRLWLLNRPGSRLAEKMDYYIKPEQAETNFLRIGKPEEIKICDPACGSGHMLTYAFDLFYAIYEEEGYEPAEIPEKILTHNLYGIEIDERAGELAAFALTMKARARQRRFFNKGVKPNICVLENVHFSDSEIKEYMDFVGRDLFTEPLQTTLHQFEEADNFGSLIRLDVTDVGAMLKILESKDVSGQLFLSLTHQKVLKALHQADYLSPKYHVVIANPPYMGNRSLNDQMQVFAKKNFSNTKFDLFAMFIERNLDLVQEHGTVAMITMQSWMFLSIFEKLRAYILNDNTILSMAHLGARAFDSIGGEVVSTTAFIIKHSYQKDYLGAYLRLTEGGNEVEKQTDLKEKRTKPYLASSAEFEKIPGAPIGYWVGNGIRKLYSENNLAGEISQAVVGLQTGDNDRFMRFWYEVSCLNINANLSNTEESRDSNSKWVPYNKGGPYRKWYGNKEYVVNWENDGFEIRNFKDSNGKLRSRPQNTNFYFREGLTWSEITSSWKSFRYNPAGSISDVKGQSAYFSNKLDLFKALTWLNSNIVEFLTKVLNPTLSFQSGDYRNIPLPSLRDEFAEFSQRACKIAKSDWDSYEMSIDFQSSPLVGRKEKVSNCYQGYRSTGEALFSELAKIESSINEKLISEYELQNDIRTEVLNEQVTLTCNPHYRYGNNKSEEELEAMLLADTMRELVSYAVGCMFGRYALDKPGLILANQGETIEDYLKQIRGPIFPADDDNVIPMLDGDWFTDDIVERFRKFLRVAFGEEYYEENLRFVEQALNIKDKRNYGIRDYFLSEFYTDHVKRYKKRPIYWLFSSPKGSFNALIYMHRYRPDTVSIVLNDYLREFRTKLSTHKNHLEAVTINASSSQGQKTRALKEIEKITKMILEMEAYEREVLYPLATEKKEIDLDDGVKVNYPKFGKALKKIPGLDAKED